jgi:hypothetical protein
MKPSPTGCTMCVQRVTGEGFPSYCADFARDGSSPGRRIPDDKLATGPSWCPKKGSAA